MAETARMAERGSEQVIEKWLGARRRVTPEQLNELLEIAQSNDGELVNVSAFGDVGGPDDYCGTIVFHRPRPKLGSVIDILLERGWGVEIFPRGIPNPTAFEVTVRNQFRR
jgi:hypothetical protein